jgi:hypothetical protein
VDPGATSRARDRRYDGEVPSPYGPELEAAKRLAREAGRLQMDLYGRLTQVRTKD